MLKPFSNNPKFDRFPNDFLYNSKNSIKVIICLNIQFKFFAKFPLENGKKALEKTLSIEDFTLINNLLLSHNTT